MSDRRRRNGEDQKPAGEQLEEVQLVEQPLQSSSEAHTADLALDDSNRKVPKSNRSWSRVKAFFSVLMRWLGVVQKMALTTNDVVSDYLTAKFYLNSGEIFTFFAHVLNA